MYNISYEKTYKDGWVIIKEGSYGDWIYVVMSGKVEISRTINGKKNVLEVIKPGEIFGELAFLGSIRRTATARAVGETMVGIIDREFLDQEFNKINPDLKTILTAVVRRLRKMIDREQAVLNHEK